MSLRSSGDGRGCSTAGRTALARRENRIHLLVAPRVRIDPNAQPRPQDLNVVDGSTWTVAVQVEPCARMTQCVPTEYSGDIWMTMRLAMACD